VPDEETEEDRERSHRLTTLTFDSQGRPYIDRDMLQWGVWRTHATRYCRLWTYEERELSIGRLYQIVMRYWND
jgi:hypothetical protein